LDGGIVAEELAESFFVIRNAMLFDEGDEVGGRVAGEGGFCEVRICGKEVVWLGVNIGEVAAASAGDEDFFADFLGALEEDDAAAAFAGFDCAEETGGAGTEDDYVEIVHLSSSEVRLEHSWFPLTS
jgi:hypothetical protein